MPQQSLQELVKLLKKLSANTSIFYPTSQNVD